MKSFRNLLKKIDVFGASYSFKYKDEDKYTTATGGFFLILFLALSLSLGIYYFIPFYNRKNFSIIYYTMNMPSTDDIRLDESEANFAIGLDCGANTKMNNIRGSDLFNVDLKYVTFAKDHEGKRNVTRYPLTSHKCNYADFYNKFNESLDLVNIQQLECLDNIHHSIQGIYNDELFTYYEFSVTGKIDTVEHYEKINNYLQEMDCKFQLFYTDLTIDFNDYSDPIKPYINSLFVQLNPILFLKMNAFFMNQYFENDNYLLFVFNEDEPTVHTLFSRYEEWNLFKGLDRGSVKPKDYYNFAKIYIRADTKKATIIRKYQKVMEFWADASSLLMAIFEVLFFLISFADTFYADLSLSKKLFFFRGVKNKHFNINRKINDIKRIVSLTDCYCNNNSASIARRKKNLVDMKPDNQEVNIYNINKNIKISERGEALGTDNYLEPKELKRKHQGMGRRRRQEIDRKINVNVINNDENHKNTLSNRKAYFMTSRLNLNSKLIKNDQKSPVEIDNSLYEYEEDINYSYNIFEIIFNTFFFCCLPNYLERKRKLTEKANDLLNKKLDVALYVKNVLLFEIMQQTLVDDKRNGIINFISRPTISTKTEDKELSEFYKVYSYSDFERFHFEINELIQNPRLEKNEINLLSLCNKDLKEIIK